MARDQGGAEEPPGVRDCQQCSKPQDAAAIISVDDTHPQVADESSQSAAQLPANTSQASTPSPALSYWAAAKPPPAKKRSKLAIISGVVGSILLLCVCSIAALIVLGRDEQLPGEPRRGEILFGTDWHHLDGTAAILHPKTTFAPSDSFAFVARTTWPSGDAPFEIHIVRVLPDGSERVLFRDPLDTPSKLWSWTSLRYSHRLQMSRMMGRSAPGNYILRIVQGTKTLAEGRFTYTLPNEIAWAGN